MSFISWLYFYTGDHCCSTGDSKMLLENASWLFCLIIFSYSFLERISVLNGNWEGRTVWIIFTPLWREEGFTLYVALLIKSGGQLAYSTKCETPATEKGGFRGFWDQSTFALGNF